MKVNPESAIWLYFQIEQDLASLIDGGTLAPGSQLPLEEELVQRYGISRTTVRSAVLELDRLGLIEIRRGRGTFVRTQKIAQEFTELTGLVLAIIVLGSLLGTINPQIQFH
jgi:GntR family transcriptional regulator